MRYVFLMPFFAFAALTAMENKSVVTLWARHYVLLEPNAPSWVPSSLSPKTLENNLLEVVAADTGYTNEFAAQQPGTSLSLAMKAWLLDQENGEAMKKRAFGKIYCYQLLLRQVANAAFSPKNAASHLKPIAKVVALAKACKDAGCTMALACNSDSASFAEIEEQHAEVVSLFPHKFISGQRKKLTMDPAFFKSIQAELGTNNSYYYIDVTERTGAESLEAARQAGVIPITLATPERLEKDLRAFKILP